MQRLTTVERQILEAVISEGGRRRGLFRLAVELGIDYRHAWRSVQALALMGLIEVSRPRGYSLVLSLYGLSDSFPNGGYQATMGSVPRISHRTRHTAQIGGIRKMLPKDISELRKSLTEQPAATYPRPDLTKDEQAKYSKVAKKVNGIRDNRLRLLYVATMVEENVRLLKEVNEHRAARGLEPLPDYDPEKVK